MIGVYLGSAFIQYRLSLGDWIPISTQGYDYGLGDIVQMAVVGFIAVIIAALTYGRAVPSGRIRITRSSAESVDGFGGARAADYSYGPSGMSSTMGFPVGMRHERERTGTFKDGAKDRIEDEKGNGNHD
ncbi:MAG: hypothetical protein ACTSUB_00700 [Candidatus Thorarchaeota archaeon]